MPFPAGGGSFGPPSRLLTTRPRGSLEQPPESTSAPATFPLKLPAARAASGRVSARGRRSGPGRQGTWRRWPLPTWSAGWPCSRCSGRSTATSPRRESSCAVGLIRGVLAAAQALGHVDRHQRRGNLRVRQRPSMGVGAHREQPQPDRALRQRVQVGGLRRRGEPHLAATELALRNLAPSGRRP